MIVPQAKGKQHCKNIQKDAKELWDNGYHLAGYSWIDCIKLALEDHRRLVEEQMALIGRREEVYNKDD